MRIWSTTIWQNMTFVENVLNSEPPHFLGTFVPFRPLFDTLQAFSNYLEFKMEKFLKLTVSIKWLEIFEDFRTCARAAMPNQTKCSCRPASFLRVNRSKCLGKRCMNSDLSLIQSNPASPCASARWGSVSQTFLFGGWISIIIFSSYWWILFACFHVIPFEVHLHFWPPHCPVAMNSVISLCTVRIKYLFCLF